MSQHKGLIIFDCDGVLVDSEGLCAQVFSEQLQGIGLEYSVDWCLEHFHGLSLPECFQYLEQECGRPLPVDFKLQLDRATLEAYDSDLRAVAGVANVLECLMEMDLPFCVASNGGRPKVLKALEITGLAQYFSNNIFTIDNVQRGKPAPDLFLHAAASMRVEPEDVFIVEDSAAGIDAALAARMRVCLFEPQGSFLASRYSAVLCVTAMDVLAKLLLAEYGV